MAMLSTPNTALVTARTLHLQGEMPTMAVHKDRILKWHIQLPSQRHHHLFRQPLFPRRAQCRACRPLSSNPNRRMGLRRFLTGRASSFRWSLRIRLWPTRIRLRCPLHRTGHRLQPCSFHLAGFGTCSMAHGLVVPALMYPMDSMCRATESSGTTHLSSFPVPGLVPTQCSSMCRCGQLRPTGPMTPRIRQGTWDRIGTGTRR